MRSLCALLLLAGAASAGAGEVILQDRTLLAAFDADSGALTRLESKTTHWTLERRPELGVSFRLHAPMPNRRDNFVLGQKQRAALVRRDSDHQVSLSWTNLVSEHGGVLPMTLRATVTLEDGTLTFAPTLENHSALTVETVDYPYLGDLNPPGRAASLEVRTMRYDNLASDQIYPHFKNALGYWGVNYPTKTFDSCFSLFCLVQSPQAGLYVEVRDPTERYLVQYAFEQHPGDLQSVAHSVPPGAESTREASHLEYRVCHFIFAPPHATVRLTPVVLRCYAGDWHAGVDLYKQWRATWFKPPQVPAWVRSVHSWQQLQIDTPEQNYAVPYRRLIDYGEACARAGVSAIQLVGWNHGGQDGGNPSQDTDPGLGTWQELHDAIAQIQARGVKMVLFGKFTWADITTDGYRRELRRYASTDPYGLPYLTGGDQYLTPTQLAGINPHRFAIMDFLSPAYRGIAVREFQKILDLGPAGWLYDEVCDRTVGKYNFAAGHGYAPPGYIYAGAGPLGQELRAAADRHDPNFLFAGEGPQDWLTQYYPLSYFRGSPTPVERYIDPQCPMMVAVTGFDDRERLNSILLNRYIIEYEPYNFKGRLSDFPLTLAYGQKIDALRRKYSAWLWDGNFQDTLGAAVSADGAHHYSVFTAANGKRAVVITNEESARAIVARVALPHPGTLVTASPEAPESVPSSGTVQIPARSAAVVLEP